MLSMLLRIASFIWLAVRRLRSSCAAAKLSPAAGDSAVSECITEHCNQQRASRVKQLHTQWLSRGNR